MRSADFDRLFLQACAIGSASEWSDPAGLAALTPADELALVALAEEHGFIGLLARNLGWARERFALALPVVERLEALRRGQLVQHLGRKAAARRVGEALQAGGIPFIAFKGVALAEEVYGDLSLRGFRDFDVMVPQERVDEAFAILAALGYREALFGGVRGYVESGAHAAGLAHADGSGVDLHWSFAPDVLDAGRVAVVWRNVRPASPGAFLPGLRLTPEMTLIHLAKHFHSHQYGELKPLVDFHVASRAYAGQVDSRRLASVARQLGLLQVFRIATAVSARGLGPAGPPAPVATAGPATALARAALTDRFLVNRSRLSRVGNWTRYLAASGSLAATWRSLVDIIVPGKLLLARFFERPYRPGMYARYYWRQFVKVVTLAKR